MFKKIVVSLIMGAVTLSLSESSFAVGCVHSSENYQTVLAVESNTTGTVSEAASKEAVNVGNKICPVTGEKIDEKAKTIYEYQGKIYNFCCPACIDEFKKDPGKYIKKIEEEKQKEQAVEKSQAPLQQEQYNHSH